MNTSHINNGYAEKINSAKDSGVQKQHAIDKLHQDSSYVDVVCLSPSKQVIQSVTQNVYKEGLVLIIMQRDHDLKKDDIVDLKLKTINNGNSVLGKIKNILSSLVIIEFVEEQRDITRNKGEYVIKCSLPDMDGLILHTQNYSQGGLFFLLNKSFHKLSLGDELKIEMFLPGELNKKQICEVVRIEDNGVALSFK